MLPSQWRTVIAACKKKNSDFSEILKVKTDDYRLRRSLGKHKGPVGFALESDLKK